MRTRLGVALRTGEQGFTLVELLIVVALIGILTSAAVPMFLRARNVAYDAAIKSDLRSAATAEESYFTETNAYSTQNPVGTDLKYDGFQPSSKSNYSGGVASITTHLNPAGTQYCLTATSRSGQSWVYSSISGMLPRNNTCSF